MRTGMMLRVPAGCQGGPEWVKYLLKIDPFVLMGSRRPGWPHQGGLMIKLSDVKVRAQYRTRVRYRLLVLQYAQAHGPSAAGRHYGLSARTIRRWRKRWQRGGVEGLVPAYPRHRARRVSPAAIELIRQARQDLGYGAARTRLWLQRVHGVRLAMGTIQRVFRDLGLPRLRRTRKREPRQMKLFEKGGTGRVDPGRRQVRADRGPLGVSVHGPGRLYALPDPAALPAAASPLEPRLPRRAPAGVPLPHQAAAV